MRGSHISQAWRNSGDTTRLEITVIRPPSPIHLPEWITNGEVAGGRAQRAPRCVRLRQQPWKLIRGKSECDPHCWASQQWHPAKGRNGYAPLALETGIPDLIAQAHKSGIGVGALVNVYHFAALWPEVESLADAGMVGFACTAFKPSVAPAGATSPLFGTNPIAFAAPTRRNPPFVLDMATSTVAIGKLAIAKRLGVPIKEGWALDKNGNSITDPVIAREARRLTPLGGSRELGSHKGYGLAAMVDILSSTLSGAAIVSVSRNEDGEFNLGNVGHFFMAVDPSAIREDDKFSDELDDLIDALRATTPADENQPVLVAGDPEWEAFKTRSVDGIPISEELAKEVQSIAEESGVAYILTN